MGSLTFVMIFGNSMLVPVLPDIEQLWGLSSSQAGLVLSVFSLFAAAMIPVSGWISQIKSKRELALYALLAIAAGGSLSAVSVFVTEGPFSYSTLLLGRVLQGAGAGIVSPLPLMIAGGFFSKRKRPAAFAFLEAVNGIAKVSSPFAGIFAVRWGGGIFSLYVLLAVSAGLLVFIFIPKAVSNKSCGVLGPAGKTMRQLAAAGMRKVFHLCLLGGIVMCLLFGLLSYFSYELEWIYDLTGMKKATVFALPLVCLTGSSWFSGQYLGRYKAYKQLLLYAAILLMVILFIAAAMFNGFSALLILMVGFAALSGIILVMCNLLLIENVSNVERDVAVSLYSMVRFAGVAAGPPVYTALMYNEAVLHLFSLLLLSGAFLLVWKRRTAF